MKTIKNSIGREIVIDETNNDMARDILLSLYWQNHPRFRFLKMLMKNAKCFDIGAGSGGIYWWRSWGIPIREDIELHGCDLVKSETLPPYEKFTEMNIDKEDFPYKSEWFDAAISSHVIEHLNALQGFVIKTARILKKHGLVYIETPTVESMNFPTRDWFINEGIPTTTTNFFDDSTHTNPVSRDKLIQLFTSNGEFALVEHGVIQMPYLEAKLVAKAFVEKDQELGSYALWSFFGFAHYIVMRKQ